MNYRLLGLGLALIALAEAQPLQAQSAPARQAPAPTPKPKLLVLGHAGSGFFTPINPFNPLPPSSLRGVLRALDLGADGVEIDLQLSKDSVVVLYHDLKLESITTGTGCVAQRTAAEITALRYRRGWPYDWFQNEQPVTLDTLLAHLNRRATFPILHLDLHEEAPCAPTGDTYDRTPELVRELMRSLRRAQVPADRLVLISNKANVLRQARRAWPALPLAFDVTTDDFGANVRKAVAEQVPMLVVKGDNASPEEVEQARAAGISVVLFGAVWGPFSQKHSAVAG